MYQEWSFLRRHSHSHYYVRFQPFHLCQDNLGVVEETIISYLPHGDNNFLNGRRRAATHGNTS